MELGTARQNTAECVECEVDAVVEAFHLFDDFCECFGDVGVFGPCACLGAVD